VGRERGPGRPGLLPPDLLPVGGEDGIGFLPQDLDLVLRETPRQEQVALLVELLELFRRKPHRCVLLNSLSTPAGGPAGLPGRGD
jgi:hypothetical protein